MAAGFGRVHRRDKRYSDNVLDRDGGVGHEPVMRVDDVGRLVAHHLECRSGERVVERHHPGKQVLARDQRWVVGHPYDANAADGLVVRRALDVLSDDRDVVAGGDEGLGERVHRNRGNKPRGSARTVDAVGEGVSGPHMAESAVAGVLGGGVLGHHERPVAGQREQRLAGELVEVRPATGRVGSDRFVDRAK